MPKSKDAPIYRENDIVKVVNPEEFIRCGYPLCIKDVAAGFTGDQIIRLTELLADFGAERIHKFSVRDQFADVIERIAYHVMKSKGFGGDTRSIHTQRNESLQDLMCYVIRKKVVKTGEYVPEHGSCGSYYEECDYEPAQLYPTGTHVILYLRPMDWQLEIDYFWIEESNVVKMKAMPKKNPYDYCEKTEYAEI